jgi:hypothetical protein
MDSRKLEIDLTELFISQEYNRIDPVNLFTNPSHIEDRGGKALEMYRTNPIFAATVRYQVKNVMRIVSDAHTRG